MAQRLGRWQQLLVDALAEHETVSVQAVIEGHLDRQARSCVMSGLRRASYVMKASDREFSLPTRLVAYRAGPPARVAQHADVWLRRASQPRLLGRGRLGRLDGSEPADRCQPNAYVPAA